MLTNATFTGDIYRLKSVPCAPVELMEACPICGLSITASDLPDHASAHFADDVPAADSICPICSLTLPVEELDGHLLAHRLIWLAFCTRLFASSSFS